jgi:predicted GIY-YIG superfamily endonuclease
MHGTPKRIVYIFRSDVDPTRHYVGITSDLAERLEWHNHGPCGHTLSNRPWSVVVSKRVSDRVVALGPPAFIPRLIRTFEPSLRRSAAWPDVLKRMNLA